MSFIVVAVATATMMVMMTATGKRRYINAQRGGDLRQRSLSAAAATITKDDSRTVVVFRGTEAEEEKK